ncbi:PIR protein,putative [Plasmodium sp.]|nr:PIR protein,putative [Plasmodium sp.]
MISFNFKLIIFSIILGTLFLIYNNDFYELYKNINHKNFLWVPRNFRSLGELMNEPITNNEHENNELREYGNTNERKYKKNIYLNDDAKLKDKLPEVTGKENTGTTNLNKYIKETYNKKKEAQSNRFSPSLKYIEIQRKVYSNFFVKKIMDFQNFLYKSNDKSSECENKKNSSDKLSSSSNDHDNYLDIFKKNCARGVRGCVFWSEAIGNYSILGAAFAVIGATKTPGSVVFGPGGIAALVVILIAVAIIILYIWLFRRRKNSLRYECKRLKNTWKHECKRIKKFMQT